MVSFFLLRGRCRFCQARISWQHPLVEFLVAALFVLAAARFSGGELIFIWLAITLLAVLFLTDLKAMVLPWSLIFPALVFFGLFDLFFFRLSVLTLLASLALGGGFFLAQYLLSRGQWIGQGDVWLGLLLAAILQRPGRVLQALAAAYLLGAAAGLWLLARKKKTLKSEIPLGPFLILAALIVIFVIE